LSCRGESDYAGSHLERVAPYFNFEVKSTAPGREDANGKLGPSVEQHYRQHNADGDSVLGHLPRCHHEYEASAEQEGAGSGEIDQFPGHFTGELHGDQGYQQYEPVASAIQTMTLFCVMMSVFLVFM
jgi:hypothetical protein